MYLTFFGFREKPFNLTPDPKFLYLNASYREALAQLRYGINERKGFVSLIGEAGTGKTTLLRRLLAELGPDVRSVLILNPAVDFDELLVFILADLGHAPPPGTPKLQLLQALNAELLDTLARGGNVVVLIDEAQDLSIPVLEELRLLSNLETAKEKILQFVLAGQPELDAMLARPELRQLRQRIAVPARLRPLARGEVSAYVAARIAAAGGDARGLFAAAALRQLYRFSRGVPRLVNVAADSALVTAYAAGTRLIDRKLMREAIADLRRGAHAHASGAIWRARVATIAVAGVIGAVMGVVASRLAGGTLGPWRTAAVSPSPRQQATVVPTATVPPAPEATPMTPPSPPEATPMAPASPLAEALAAAAPTAPAAADVGVPATNGGGELAADASPIASPHDVMTPPAAAASVPTPGSAPASEPPRRIYVTEGDDLTHIARRNYGYATEELLALLQTANPEIVDRDMLTPGQIVVLPPDPNPPPATPETSRVPRPQHLGTQVP